MCARRARAPPLTQTHTHNAHAPRCQSRGHTTPSDPLSSHNIEHAPRIADFDRLHIGHGHRGVAGPRGDCIDRIGICETKTCGMNRSMTCVFIVNGVPRSAVLGGLLLSGERAPGRSARPGTRPRRRARARSGRTRVGRGREHRQRARVRRVVAEGAQLDRDVLVGSLSQSATTETSSGSLSRGALVRASEGLHGVEADHPGGKHGDFAGPSAAALRGGA